MIGFVILTNSKTKFNYAKLNTQEAVKVTKLTYLVDFDIAVHICILIILGKRNKKINNKIKVEVENL